MVAAIHQTLIEDAVPHPKHMGYFVAHHPHRPEFYQIIVDLILLQLEKTLIVPRKRKDPSPLSNTRQTKDKVPFLSRIEVSHTDSYHAECICG